MLEKNYKSTSQKNWHFQICDLEKKLSVGRQESGSLRYLFLFLKRPPRDAVPPSSSSSSSSSCSYSRPRRLGVRSRMMIMMQQTMTPLHASSAQRHRRCRSSRVMSLRRNSRSSSFFRKTATSRQSMGRSVEAEHWNYPKDLTRASGEFARHFVRREEAGRLRRRAKASLLHGAVARLDLAPRIIPYKGDDLVRSFG